MFAADRRALLIQKKAGLCPAKYRFELPIGLNDSLDRRILKGSNIQIYSNNTM
jgi:hypothetical protein